MKFLFVAFLALAVGTSALPQDYEIDIFAESREQRNPIENQIRGLIEALTQWIRDNNLDPLQVNRVYLENKPQPGVNIAVLIERLNLVGLSNIAIHRMDYSIVGNRLRMDLSLPRITFSLGNARVEIDFHGTEYSGEFKGDFVLISARMTFDIRVNIGIISGISLRSVAATFRLQNIWSDFSLVINEEDFSEGLNEIINIIIPRWLRENQNALDAFISRVILEVGNAVLNPSFVQMRGDGVKYVDFPDNM